jgi:hypothetical protein
MGEILSSRSREKKAADGPASARSRAYPKAPPGGVKISRSGNVEEEFIAVRVSISIFIPHSKNITY